MDSDFEVKYDALLHKITKIEKGKENGPPPLPPRQVSRCSVSLFEVLTKSSLRYKLYHITDFVDYGFVSFIGASVIAGVFLQYFYKFYVKIW